MPRPAKKEKVLGAYFTWLLGKRDGGYYYADGRSNVPKLGRYSLGTCDRREAGAGLSELDLVMAVEHGRADASPLKKASAGLLTIDEGAKAYLDYADRPASQDGVVDSTRKRYRAYLNKFVPFAKTRKVAHWNGVTVDVLRAYGRWLDKEDYHDSTQRQELQFLKQCVSWFIQAKMLPPENLIHLPISKATGTSTHCYSIAEFQAIVGLCRSRAKLAWLGDIAMALGMTGLRIAELAGLCWSDVDLDRGVIKLLDNSRRSRRSERHTVRTTKNHRGRVLDIHPELRPVFERLAGLRKYADGRVFRGFRGDKLNPGTVLRILQRDVLPQLAAEFPEITDGTLHSFRHFFCSFSANANVPEQMLMDWLGHSDSKMIRSTYYHSQREESKRRMNEMKFLGEGQGSRGGSGRPDAECEGGVA